jgi:hypothetical protein
MSTIEITDTPLPTSLEGEPLDHNCLHCQLALPVQHFMTKHPEKSREDVVKEATEMVAELIASCGEWNVVTTYRDAALDYLPALVRGKWESYQRLQRGTVRS